MDKNKLNNVAKNKLNNIGYKMGYILGAILLLCGAAIVVSLTVKFISWLF